MKHPICSEGHWGCGTGINEPTSVPSLAAAPVSTRCPHDPLHHGTRGPALRIVVLLAALAWIAWVRITQPTIQLIALRRLVLLAVAMLPAWGQTDTVSVAAQGGYTWRLEDTPPHGIVKGVAVTTRAAERWRVGVEFLDADLFGPYEDHEEHARLLAPTVAYEFGNADRVRPFVVFGVGWTQYRALIPDSASPDSDELVYRWDFQSAFNLGGGAGIRLYLTKRLFVAPEARVGLLPWLRTTVAVGLDF